MRTLVSRYWRLLQSASVSITTGSTLYVDTRVLFCRLLLRNRVAAHGHGGSPSRLCRRIAALVAGGLQLCLHRSEIRQWGLSA